MSSFQGGNIGTHGSLLYLTFGGTELSGVTGFEAGKGATLNAQGYGFSGGSFTAKSRSIPLKFDSATASAGNTQITLITKQSVYIEEHSLSLDMDASTFIGDGGTSNVALSAESITNGSGLTFPMVIARWAQPSGLIFGDVYDGLCKYQTTGGAEIHIEASAYHAYGIDCVVFTLDDRYLPADSPTTVLTATATGLTLSSHDCPSWSAGVPVYRGAFDASGLSSGSVMSRFVAYPSYGITANVRDTDTGSWTGYTEEYNGNLVSYPHYNNAGSGGTTITPSYAWVSESGDNSTGAGHTDSSIARTTPYSGLYTALIGAGTAVGKGNGALAPGLIVYLEEGSYTGSDYGLDTSVRHDTTKGWQFICAAPDATENACKIVDDGVASGIRTQRICWKDISWEPSDSEPILIRSSGNPVGTTDRRRRVWFNGGRVLSTPSRSTDWRSLSTAIVYGTGFESDGSKFGFPGSSLGGSTILSRNIVINDAGGDIFTLSRMTIMCLAYNIQGTGLSHVDFKQWAANYEDANDILVYSKIFGLKGQPIFINPLYYANNVAIINNIIERRGNVAGGKSQLNDANGKNWLIWNNTHMGVDYGMSNNGGSPTELDGLSVQNNIFTKIISTNTSGGYTGFKFGTGVVSNHIVDYTAPVGSELLTLGFDYNGTGDAVFENNESNYSTTQNIKWYWNESTYDNALFEDYGITAFELELNDATSLTTRFYFDSASNRDAAIASEENFYLDRNEGSVGFTGMNFAATAGTELGTTGISWNQISDIDAISTLLDVTTYPPLIRVGDGTTYGLGDGTVGLGIHISDSYTLSDFNATSTSPYVNNSFFQSEENILVQYDIHGNERTVLTNVPGAFAYVTTSSTPINNRTRVLVPAGMRFRANQVTKIRFK